MIGFKRIKDGFIRTPKLNIVIGEIVFAPWGEAFIRIKKPRSDTYEYISVVHLIALILKSSPPNRYPEEFPLEGEPPQIKENNDDSHTS